MRALVINTSSLPFRAYACAIHFLPAGSSSCMVCCLIRVSLPAPGFDCFAGAGMLIYKLLGDSAQSEFAKTWGISYGARLACVVAAAHGLSLLFFRHERGGGVEGAG